MNSTDDIWQPAWRWVFTDRHDTRRSLMVGLLPDEFVRTYTCGQVAVAPEPTGLFAFARRRDALAFLQVAARRDVTRERGLYRCWGWLLIPVAGAEPVPLPTSSPCDCATAADSIKAAWARQQCDGSDRQGATGWPRGTVAYRRMIPLA